MDDVQAGPLYLPKIAKAYGMRKRKKDWENTAWLVWRKLGETVQEKLLVKYRIRTTKGY